VQTKTVNISPAMAAEWLESNTINRPLRRTVVDGLVLAYQRGEHRLTHQGIAFADSGELLDGQHRLTAIAKMPADFSVQMLVTTGLPKDAFDSIDQGLKRSHGDVLRISQGLAAVARFMATTVETSRSGITSQSLVPYVRGVEVEYARLMNFCGKSTKTWSSAAVRSAAILRLLNGGDSDYICINYYALNHAEFDSMSPITQSLYRQQVSGRANSQGYDLFCRAFKAFDFRSASTTKLQMDSVSASIQAARAIIQTRVLGQKNAASAMPAAKKLNGANSKAKATA
jgi:hypothetical protein